MKRTILFYNNPELAARADFFITQELDSDVKVESGADVSNARISVVVVSTLAQAEEVNKENPFVKLVLSSDLGMNRSEAIRAGNVGVVRDSSTDPQSIAQAVFEAYHEKKNFLSAQQDESKAYQFDEAGRISLPRFKNDILLGTSPLLGECFEYLQSFVNYKDDLKVITLTGEKGVGKSQFARVIASNLPGSFEQMNIGGRNSETFGSEIMGYGKGAFTGQDPNGKSGLLKRNNGGVVFLDEVGNLTIQDQSKLLDVLQSGEYTPNGGKPETFKGTIILATNKNLPELVRQGMFMDDFYDRIMQFSMEIPNLESRAQDIPLLINGMLKGMNEKNGRALKIAENVVDTLQNWSYPGNVRALESIMKNLYMRENSNLITEGTLWKVVESLKAQDEGFRTRRYSEVNFIADDKRTGKQPLIDLSKGQSSATSTEKIGY